MRYINARTCELESEIVHGVMTCCGLMIRVIKMFKVIVILLTIWGFGLWCNEKLCRLLTVSRLKSRPCALGPRTRCSLRCVTPPPSV